MICPALFLLCVVVAPHLVALVVILLLLLVLLLLLLLDILTVNLIIKLHPLRRLGGRPLVVLTRPDALAAVQALAILTMLVDHLGAVGYLGDWSRLVGRAALPAFVVMVAVNSLSLHSPRRVICRFLLLFAISQPLWWLSVGSWDLLCILVTLLAVYLLTLAYSLRWGLLGLVTLSGFLIISPLVEYGALPLLLVPLVLVPSFATLCLALSWPFLQYAGFPAFQVASLLGLLLVLFLVRFPFNVPRLPRMLSRYFYPLHLGLIGLSKTII